MTTETQLIPAVLDEAEAIAQAEWLRLTRDWNQWDRDDLRHRRYGPPSGPLRRPHQDQRLKDTREQWR